MHASKINCQFRRQSDCCHTEERKLPSNKFQIVGELWRSSQLRKGDTNATAQKREHKQIIAALWHK